MQPLHVHNGKILNDLPIVFLALLLVTGLLTGCHTTPATPNGITFVARRGDPPAQLVAWSPTDPNEMLVVASHGMGPGPGSVYILDLKTGQRQEIAKSESGNFTGAIWAPDGKSVLIRSGERTFGFEPPGWWKVNVGGKSVEYIGQYMGPSWSPDGKTMAAFSWDNQDGNLRLQLIGSDKHTEVIYTADSPGYVAASAWSPDGQYLAFSYGDTRSGDIYVFNLQTRQTTQLTQNKLNDQLAWSSQGGIIAVQRDAPDTFDPSLHLISADGRCDVEIPNLEYPSSPTWSPDGKRLAYVAMDGIYALDANTVLGRDVYQGLCP